MTNEEKLEAALRTIREVADRIKDTSVGMALASGLERAADDLEREAKTCKFNCRTAKENWVAGFSEALSTKTMIRESLHQSIAEDCYKEWKK